MDKGLKYGELTQQIIGAAFEVHGFLGNGFQEVIYQRALAQELKQSGIQFAREINQQIFYKDIHIGTRRADFLIEGKVLVELKATSELTDAHWNQIISYLKAYRLEVGLLINFGSKSLTFKRFVL